MWSICQRTGYASERVRIVPISGCMEGDNVFVESKHMRGWYTGPTLLQALGDVIQALPVRAEANIHRLMAMVRLHTHAPARMRFKPQLTLMRTTTRRGSRSAWWSIGAGG
jgi:sulfate adenylyltransferase subunit 1 (EFTu-like GTPase family)